MSDIFGRVFRRISICAAQGPCVGLRRNDRARKGVVPVVAVSVVVVALELDTVIEAIVEFLGWISVVSSFLPACRWWFSMAVCSPEAFRMPAEIWYSNACQELDVQLGRVREPPPEDEFDDLRVGLEHAEEEVQLTEISASFPSGVTVKLLRYAQRLGALVHWLHAGDARGNIGNRRAHAWNNGIRDVRTRCVQREVVELKRRVELIVDAISKLRKRLPDPELPMRWAQWFEDMGDIVGLSRDLCARYRSQREQVAAVWANNRRTFLSTDEHVQALVESLEELADLAFAPFEDVAEANASRTISFVRLSNIPTVCCKLGGRNG